MLAELERLGAKHVVITSNLMTKKDGGFYARQARIDDPGIVAYFELKGNQKAMACDKWDLPEHNIWAIYLSVQAIRGLERWGGSDFLDGLFSGFKALPGPDDVIVPETNHFDGVRDLSELNKRYRQLVKEFHPDVGGSPDEFNAMRRQYEVCKKRMGGAQ